MRQTYKDIVWLVADQLYDERKKIWDDPPEKIVVHYEPIKEGRAGNLAAVDNWALQWCRDNDIELLIFLQDFIWMPPFGALKFLNDAKVHPFALLTGSVDASMGPERWGEAPHPEWDIFAPGVAESPPPPPYDLDTRKGYGHKAGRLSNHAWEINYGALPHALINAGVDFDEDYDYGTQWENTQFSFDIARKFGGGNADSQAGYVYWTPDNRAIGMPHRDYFPQAHDGEKVIRNDGLFWTKNRGLLSGTLE